MKIIKLITEYFENTSDDPPFIVDSVCDCYSRCECDDVDEHCENCLEPKWKHNVLLEALSKLQNNLS